MTAVKKLFGYIPMPGEVRKYLATLPRPLFAEAAINLEGTGKGKTVLAYEAARRVMGQDLDPGPQKIGDCVSWGWSGAVDLIACVEVLAGEAEEFRWELRTCTEATYAFSRVEVGKRRLGNSDGSTGSWAAGAVTKYGTLSRKALGPYDPRRAKSWGYNGVPDEHEPAAKEHLIRTATLVTSWEQARDALANGYPIPICSGVGFQAKRDSHGFINPRGSWAHCMKLVATRDDGKPGALCMNSWGNDHASEPKGEFDIPGNAWWITPEAVNRILRERDSYAISGFNGYPARPGLIDWLV